MPGMFTAGSRQGYLSLAGMGVGLGLKLGWYLKKECSCWREVSYEKISGALSSNKVNKHVVDIRAETWNRARCCHSESSYS